MLPSGTKALLRSPKIARCWAILGDGCHEAGRGVGVGLGVGVGVGVAVGVGVGVGVGVKEVITVTERTCSLSSRLGLSPAGRGSLSSMVHVRVNVVSGVTLAGACQVALLVGAVGPPADEPSPSRHVHRPLSGVGAGVGVVVPPVGVGVGVGVVVPPVVVPPVVMPPVVVLLRTASHL
jgi:hypothetical protein